MKKIISGFLFAFIFAGSVSAADLRDFSVVLGGTASVPAGTVLPITIIAYDTDNNEKTDYSGPVGIMASVGDIVVQETGNTLTQTFSAGRWTGSIQVLGSALPLNLTCVDFASGATGTAFKIVSPQVYSKLLVITDGMTWAPGTAAGFTGLPATKITTIPFAVTVYAVDAWNNTINSGFPRVRVNPTTELVVMPALIDMDMSVDAKANTVFTLTFSPNPDEPRTISIFASDLDNASNYGTLTDVYFSSLNSYYIWAEGPASAVAGQDFTVTVKASHALSGDPIVTFTDTVQITAVDFGGNSLSVGLLPDPAPSGPCVAGVKNFVVQYLKSSANDATGIKISPTYIGPGSYTISNAGEGYSNVITIFAAAPDSFNLEASRLKLKRNENSVLRVKIEDQYANPVSNTAVDFLVIAGTGILKDSLGNTSVIRSINTNLYGYAYITVTAACNTITTVSAAVAGIAGTQTESIEFADVIEKEQVRNYPNPFNPLQGPTTFEYYLDDAADVTMTLYSFSGAQVWKKEIPAGTMPGGKKGYNPYSWNGITDRNMPISAGLYTLKIEVKAPAGKYTLTRKIAVKK